MHEVRLEQFDEDAGEVYVAEWLKSVGDEVAEGDVLLEVMTDKANFEVPAPFDGVLREQRVGVNERVNIGDTIAVIETSDDKR